MRTLRTAPTVPPRRGADTTTTRTWSLPTDPAALSPHRLTHTQRQRGRGRQTRGQEHSNPLDATTFHYARTSEPFSSSAFDPTTDTHSNMLCQWIFSVGWLGFLFVLYTTGNNSNSFWPSVTLQWISVPSCLCLRDRMNWAHHHHHHHYHHHASTSLSRFFPLYHHISLGITGSFSRGRSMLRLRFLSHLWRTGKPKIEAPQYFLVKVQKQLKEKSMNLFWGRTRQRYLECDANLNLSHCVIISLFRERI